MTPTTLTKFLYLLGRDDLPLGAVERIAAQAITPPDVEVVYSNPGLAMWAEELAHRLLPPSDTEEVEVTV